MQRVLIVIIIHTIIRRDKSGNCEFVQLTPRHSQCIPYLRHVHLFVLQYFVQLQQMTFSVSDGAADWSVCKGISLPSSAYHPQSSGFKWWLNFSTPSLYNTKAMVFNCSRCRWEYSWTPCHRTVYILNYQVLLHSYHHKAALILHHPRKWRPSCSHSFW